MSSENLDRLKKILHGGDVLRFHTVGKSVEQQNVAEHTWRAMVILLHIWPDAPTHLIFAVLYHDVAELITGDAPAQFKWHYPNLKEQLDIVTADIHNDLRIPNADELSEGYYLHFKIVDMLELFITVRHQHTYKAREIADRLRVPLLNAVEKLPYDERNRVREIFEYFDQH